MSVLHVGNPTPKPGDIVFTLMFTWLDGSHSWAAIIGGVHLYAASPNESDLLTFSSWGDALLYARRHYAWVHHAFVKVDRMRLQRT